MHGVARIGVKNRLSTVEGTAPAEQPLYRDGTLPVSRKYMMACIIVGKQSDEIFILRHRGDCFCRGKASRHN